MVVECHQMATKLFRSPIGMCGQSKIHKLENRKYLRNNQIGEITKNVFFDGIESYNKFEDENEKYGRSYKEKHLVTIPQVKR